MINILQVAVFIGKQIKKPQDNKDGNFWEGQQVIQYEKWDACIDTDSAKLKMTSNYVADCWKWLGEMKVSTDRETNFNHFLKTRIMPLMNYVDLSKKQGHSFAMSFF